MYEIVMLPGRNYSERAGTWR